MHPSLRLASGLILLLAPARAADWPEFRGPTGQGHAEATGLPVAWSASSNVVWKAPVPGLGWSSPVCAGDRIFLTTGVTAGEGVSLRVLALDAATGRVAWETEVFRPEEAGSQPMHNKNSPASATPLVSDGRVYAHFGHHGIACLDGSGKIVWRNNRRKFNPVHGNGGSPILAGDRIVFNADGGAEPSVQALDIRTGEPVWSYRRETPAKKKFSFSTPLLISVHGKPQIISPGSGAVCALDPADGREIWRVRYGEGYSVVPRPVFGHGLVFLSSGYDKPELLAIRVDGRGDVTETHVAWRASKGAPLTPSPLLVGDELYTVSDIGMVTCWDARTGAVHYQERVPGDHSASPLFADGRLYLQSEKGEGTVLRAGRTFVKLATNPLHERSLASPAVVGDDLLIRTAGHLFRLSR